MLYVLKNSDIYTAFWVDSDSVLILKNMRQSVLTKHPLLYQHCIVLLNIQSHIRLYTLSLYNSIYTSKYIWSFCWAFLRSSSEPNLVPHVIQHYTWPHLSCLCFILQEKCIYYLLRESMANPGFKSSISTRLTVSFQRIGDASFHKFL